MATQNTDPRYVGTSGLQGLRFSENEVTDPNLVDYRKLNTLGTISAPGIAKVGYSGAGDSKYDRRDYLSEENFYDLPNYRGESESGLLKITNGLAKGVALAGTTFLDGTVGLIIGAGNALSQKDASQLWDNDFSRGLKNFTDSLEEQLPNYYTNKENERKWYQNIGTANFIGDKLIKNLGFTVGAYYSGSVWTKPLSLISAIADTGVGAAVASGLGASLSAVNEGRIEALNNSTDWYNLQKAQLDNEYLKQLDSLEFYKGTKHYDALLSNLQEDYDNKLNDISKSKERVGNADLLFNLPILLASNLVEFGKLYSRGFSTAERLNKITGTPGNYVSNFSKLEKLGKAVKTSTSEGTEEVLQQFAADVAGNAYLPKEYNLSFSQAIIDDDANQQTVNWLKEAANTLHTTLNNDDTWEQWFIGALTGALGMPTFGKANNANAWLGKDKTIGLSGGAVETILDYNREKELTNTLVDRMNQRVQSDEFLNYYQGLVRHNKFQNDMNKAADEGRAKEFKDAEYAQMISDIAMFKKAGRLDDYRDLLQSAYNTSDENLEAIIKNTTNITQDNTGKSISVGPFIDSAGNSMLATDEGKQEIISKLTSAKDEMLNAVNLYSKAYDKIENSFGNSISDSQKEQLVWYKLLSSNQKERALSIAETVKPLLKDVASSITAKLDDLVLSEEIYGTPLTGKALQLSESYRNSINILESLSSKDNLSLATIIGGNKKIKNLIKEVLQSNDISIENDDYLELIQDIDDIEILLEDSEKYSKKVEEFINNPEKINTEQTKEVKKEVQKAQKRKVKTINEQLNSVNYFSDIKNILEDETVDAATKDKALRASTNQVAKDYNKLLQAVKATKAKATQLDSQLKSDINKILDNLVDNANTVEDLDSEGVLVADPEILRTDNTENSDDLFIRSQKAVQVIKSVFGDTLRTNEEPIIEITSADDDVPSPDFDDESDDELTTGSQEVPTTKPVNDPANPKEERRTAVIDGVDASIDENGNIDTYLSKEETGAVQQDIEAKSKEETKDIQEDTSKKEGNKETLIRPSVSQYDLTRMSRNSNGVEFNKVPEAGRQYLEQINIEGKNAFEWINEGGLQKYLQNKGKLYVGIDPRFSETTPVIFIKNQNTYYPIAILWESDSKIDSFAGLREITNKVREEYQSNKVENTPYVSPNIEIPAENVNITSGRVAYTNKAKHLVKDAIVDSEISSDNADILVIADGNLVGGTGKARDYRISGSGSSGMAYISIPNARRGGFRGNTLVPIIPKRYSEVKDSTESFMTNVNAAIQKLAEALNKGDINTYKTDLKKLGDYLTLSYLDIGYQTDEEGNVVRFFFKQIQRNPDGSVVKVNRNGKEVVKSDPISSVAVGASVEEISAAIENALIQIQVPIRVNKNFVKDKRYNQKLIEQGLVETYATRLKSEAAYFTFTAPTVQQKPVETTTESKKEVKPTESNASDDLFDLDNFGVSDVLTKKMVGSTVPIEPTSESLSRYGLELNKEYSAYDIIKALKEVSSPISSKVVDLLMRAAREMGIKYTIEKGNGTDFGASRGNQISIYTDPSDSKFTHVVLHETIHSFTSWLLNPKNSSKLTSSEKQTVKEIQSLFELARKNGVTNEFGASTSVDEFVSELANPEFANQLSRIKVEEKKSLLGRLKEKIKELIHKFLGRSYEKQYSNVKDELEKLLEQAISYREVYDSEFLMSNYTREELEILRNAPRDNEGHLLAPNEKPTNLTEKQYAQVRTKAFKDWFGDWINSPSEASKVVDKNGEPLVVYHGNKYSAPITEFKEGFKNTFNTAKKGYYFTDNIEDAKYFSDTEGYSEIAKEQKKYLDNVTNNYKVIYNIENSGKDVIEFYDTDWGPLYVPLKSNNKTSIIKAIKESKEYKQALNDYNRYLEFANSNGQILSVFLNIRDTKNIRDYNITGLGAHQYIAQSPNQIKSATDNNGEFSRTNNNIYYMRPQPKYLGSPQEISNIIDSYRNTYSINREVVQNAVNRINEAAGKTIAKLGRGSLHEGIQAYKVDIIEEPTLDTLWKAHSNSLLEYSKQEVGEPMTEFEKEELINLGYSEDWIETATKDEINYARVCAGV